jgi:hypothetical protein
LPTKRIAVLIVRARSNRIQDLLPVIPESLAALASIHPRQVARVGSLPSRLKTPRRFEPITQMESIRGNIACIEVLCCQCESELAVAGRFELRCQCPGIGDMIQLTRTPQRTVLSDDSETGCPQPDLAAKAIEASLRGQREPLTDQLNQRTVRLALQSGAAFRRRAVRVL